MQFPKVAALILTLSLAACGHEEQRVHGEIEHEGTVVTYESWYAPPSLGERFNQSEGIAARIAVDGKTMILTPGVGHPKEWDNGDGSSLNYSNDFWAAITRKFEALPVEKDREDDFHVLLFDLKRLRDTPRTLPADALTQGLTIRPSEDSVPVITDPNHIGETDEEAARSREVGEAAIKKYQDDQIEKGWSLGPVDIRKAFNRGKKRQNFLAGWEFTQKIDLYKQHTLLTKFDHSGTVAVTYRRPKGSHGAWERYNDQFVACNHGDCPGTGSMRQYETCDSGAVSDWYANDAECRGNWMSSHLCNDDTSMQINNAQGIWTGDECPGWKRGIAPHCGRQFK